MTTCRPIAAIDLPELIPGQPPTDKPEVTWLDPRELLVDESYQRGVGQGGLKLIRKIIENFDWRRFKPPTCVWTANGLEVIDGQHSAIAAATHPGISAIPVLVVEAELVSDRASAFVGTNKDRLPVTQMQLHAAAVVAGDEQAAAIERVCAACGVRVLRMPPSRGQYKPKDTVAVAALADLVRRVGERLAISVLGVLAEADLAPITSIHLRAAEAILLADEYRDQIEPAELTRAIVALGDEADKEAKVFAATLGVPRWRGLIGVWFKKAKKRRKPEAEGRPSPMPGNPAMTGSFQMEGSSSAPLQQEFHDEVVKPHAPEMLPSNLRAAPQPEPAPPAPAKAAPPKQAPTVPRRPLGASARFSGSSPALIAEHARMGDPRARRDG